MWLCVRTSISPYAGCEICADMTSFEALCLERDCRGEDGEIGWGGVWNGWTLLSSRSLLTRLLRGTGETVRSGEQVCGFYVCMDDFSLMHKWWNRWFCWFRELSFSCKWKRWYSIIELWILDVEWKLCFGLCMNVGLLLNTKIRGTRAHYATVL